MHKVQYYKIYGGIGNQLFQYAHGISEIKKGKNVRFILNRDFSLKVFNDLPELFTINPDLVFIPKNKFELFLAKAFAKYICKSWHTGFFQDFNFAEFIKTENIQFLKKKEYENTSSLIF